MVGDKMRIDLPSTQPAWSPAPERDPLANALGVIRRRWVTIVAIVLICIIAAVFNHERGTPSYKATADVTFANSAVDTALQIQRGSNDPLRDAGTNVLIAKSPAVAKRARSILQTSVSADELRNSIDVEAAPNADVLNISAQWSDPLFAAEIANAFANGYIRFVADSQRKDIDATITVLKQQLATLPTGSTARADALSTLQQLQSARASIGSGARIIGSAEVPSAATGLNLSALVVLAGIVGLVIALTVVFVLESIDRRVGSIEALEAAYRLPALASIPDAAFKQRTAAQRSKSLEPYRILRSSLDFAAINRPVHTLLVTSAVSGEGKTTVSVDLAHTIALTGRRVILVEVDLRRPTFSKHFDLDPRLGLTTALLNEAPLEDLLFEPFPDLPNFSVLPSGRLPPNPAELLGSEMMPEVLRELRRGDAMVILDAPPLNPVADAQALLNSTAVDGAIVVARADMTTHDQADRARAILDRHLFEPLGIVVTGLRNPARYGYEAYEVPGAPAPLDSNVQRLSPRSEHRASS